MHIVLIHKQRDTDDIKDYRMISLASSCYNIIATFLANRMKPKMQHTIESTHDAFIKGRQI